MRSRFLSFSLVSGVLALFFAGEVNAGALPQIPAAPEGPANAWQVQITSITPILRAKPGAEDAFLEVGGTLRNPASVPATVRLTLNMAASTPVVRSDLSSWLQGLSVGSGLVAVDSQPDQRLSAGGQRAFKFKVAANKLPLGAAARWGPRGVSVVAQGVGSEVPLTGQARSFMLWDSGHDFTASNLTVLLPIVPTAPEIADAWESGTTPGASPSPRLASAARLAQLAGVEPVLDPNLLSPQNTAPESLTLLTKEGDLPGSASPSASAQVPGNTAGGAPGGADRQVAPEFAALKSSPVQTLPTGDVDVPFWLAADRAGKWKSRLQTRDQHSLSLLRSQGWTLRRDLLWLDGYSTLAADEAKELFFTGQQPPASQQGQGGQGKPVIVIPDSTAPLSDDLTYTPSGFSQTSQGKALIGDVELAAALQERLPPVLAYGIKVEGVNPPQHPSLAARQWALAQLAVLTRELPSKARSFVVSLPRDYSASEGQEDCLRALFQARWARPTSLSDLLASPPADEDRQSIAPGSSQIRLTPARKELASQVGTSTDFLWDFAATLKTKSGQLRQPLLSAMSVLYGVSLANDSAGSERVLSAWNRQLSPVFSAIKAAPSSTINLINSVSHIPVGVSNSLRYPITVQVNLQAQDPRLQVSQPIRITVPAHSALTAQVPVKAVGSGDIKVTITLTNPGVEPYQGAPPLAKPSAVNVRIRAGWESTGTWVAAAITLTIFLVGLVFNITKRRRKP